MVNPTFYSINFSFYIRTILLTFSIFFIAACALPLEIAKRCGIPGIYADKECIELAFEKKWTVECRLEGYGKFPTANQIGTLKKCVHKKRLQSVWNEWLSK